MSPIDLHNLTDRPALFRALTYVIQLSAIGAVYFCIARFYLDLVSVYPSATAIWPPAGFALAAVLLGGYRVIPAIFAAASAAIPTGRAISTSSSRSTRRTRSACGRQASISSD